MVFPLQVSNDGKHPLLEFAMSYFRESNFEFPNADGSIKDNNKKKKKKKGAKNSDWTWKEQVCFSYACRRRSRIILVEPKPVRDVILAPSHIQCSTVYNVSRSRLQKFKIDLFLIFSY
jgi:hypothetical protein